MTTAVAPPARDDAHVLRTSLLAVAGISLVGIAAELLVERHWGSAVRYVPWICLAVMAWAVYALARRPTRRVVQAARVIALIDFRYQDIWATMSEPERWWAAFSKSVGPAPTFAPAALAEVSLILLVATRRHPALQVA